MKVGALFGLLFYFEDQAGGGFVAGDEHLVRQTGGDVCEVAGTELLE